MQGLARKLKQDVTRWPVSGSDGFGGFTFGAPSLYRGRYEERNEMFMTPEGDEVVSTGVVYTDSTVNPGDYLALGNHTTVVNPLTVTTAHRCRNVGRVTDLRASMALTKVWL